MAHPMDVYSYILFIDPADGLVIQNGSRLDARRYPSVVVRYVVVNNSKTATGDFYLNCWLLKDGQGFGNPVSTPLTLRPGQAMTYEHRVFTQGIANARFDAGMVADPFNNVVDSTTATLQVVEAPA